MISQWSLLLTTAVAVVEEVEEKGKLFDFDATLPLMMIQIVVLVAALNALFYKPVDPNPPLPRTVPFMCGHTGGISSANTTFDLSGSTP